MKLLNVNILRDMMTEKRFRTSKGIFEEGYPSETIIDNETGKTYYKGCAYHKSSKEICKLLNKFVNENEQLKKELLFFYDVANCECSTNWRKDMEKGCKRFFNCTYEEAKEKYGDYDGMWWEIDD